MVAFHAYQAFLTFKKVGPLVTVLNNFKKDPFLPLAWILAVDETSTAGHEHVHMLIACHMSFQFKKEYCDTLCGVSVYLQQVGDTKVDQDAIIAYCLKQKDIEPVLVARSAAALVEIEERVHYIRNHKQVPLHIYVLGGKAFAEKYLRDEERALKARQQAWAIAERQRQQANSTAMAFLQ